MPIRLAGGYGKFYFAVLNRGLVGVLIVVKAREEEYLSDDAAAFELFIAVGKRLKLEGLVVKLWHSRRESTFVCMRERTFVCTKIPRSDKQEGGEDELTVTSTPHTHEAKTKKRKNTETEKAASKRHKRGR